MTAIVWNRKGLGSSSPSVARGERVAEKGRRSTGLKDASADYWKRYEALFPKYFWSGETRLANIVLRTAKGSTLVDVDGKEYIDLASQWSTNDLGNVHPEIFDATLDALVRYGFLIYFMNPTCRSLRLWSDRQRWERGPCSA